MKICFDEESLPQKLSKKNTSMLMISTKKATLILRVSIYVFLISLPLWFYIAFPNTIFDEGRSSLVKHGIIILFFLVLIPFIHEFLHLISRPWQLFRKDTYFLIDFKKSIFQMKLAIIPGGTITREGFIWMSLFPLLMLTIIPFIMISTSNWFLPVSYGLLACYNLSLSAIDIIQAILVWRGMRFKEVLAYGVD